MRANEFKICLSALSLALLGGAAFAQVGQPVRGTTLPTLPPLGAMANQALPGGLAGAKPTAAPSVELTYRDPSAPLSIDEISEMQAKKASADLYKKFGLTDIAQIKVTKDAASSDPSGPAAPVVVVTPPLVVVSLAIWGPPNGLQAEALIDGSLRKIHLGDTIRKGVVVSAISAQGIQFRIVKQQAKAPAAQPTTASTDTLDPKTTAQAAPAPVKHIKHSVKSGPAGQTYWALVGRRAEMPL